MATKTYGDTGSANIASATDSSRYLVSQFKPDDWGGQTDPQSDRAIYVVTKMRVYVKYTDTDATSTSRTVNIVCGSTSSNPTTKANSLGINSVGTGMLSGSYNYHYADTSFALGSDNTYWAGVKPNSASGATVNRGTSSYETLSVEASTGTTKYTWSNSIMWLEFTYYGLPGQPSSISASTTGQTSVNVTFSQVATTGVAGSATGYRVDYKKSSDSTWTTFTTTSGYPLSGVDVTGLTAATSYDFRVAAVNGVTSLISTATGPWSTTKSATTQSSVPAPAFSGSFDSGQIGSSYSDYVTLTNTSSVSIQSGSIPTNLSGAFNSATGRYTISGDPNTTGTFNFTLRATGDGGTKDASYSISIAAQPAPSWVDQSLSSSVVVGDSYDDYVSATNTTYYSYTGSLPTGLQFDANSGRLYGTLTAAGTFSFTITANGPGGSASKEFSILVDTVILQGGKRFNGATPVTLSIYSRKSGSSWIELTIAKRKENGIWVDI